MKITDDAIYFWGSIFSNFYAVNNDQGRTSEKVFMQQKAIVFEDYNKLAEISKARSPMEAKRLGRQVRNFDSELWDLVKYEAMIIALQWKLSVCDNFRKALKDTGKKLMVEASPDDNIWGIGFDKHTAEDNRELWGQNLLGEALMEVRKGL